MGGKIPDIKSNYKICPLFSRWSIGDDWLPKMATGNEAPDRFTHGTSAQHVEWFKRGMDSGDPPACNTFARATNNR
jgi:predicted metalloprotease